MKTMGSRKIDSQFMPDRLVSVTQLEKRKTETENGIENCDLSSQLYFLSIQRCGMEQKKKENTYFNG